MPYGLQYPFISDDGIPTLEWFRQITSYIMSRTKVATYTSSLTIPVDVFHARIDATGGARTATLPTASTCAGRQILITKVDSSGNAVTVACSGSETIQGSATISLAAQWNKALVISNGNTGWERIV